MGSSVRIKEFTLDIGLRNDQSEQSNPKNVYKVTNSKGKSIFIEGSETSNSTGQLVNIEDADIADLIRLLDTDKNKKISSSEAKQARLARIESLQLIDNHAFRSQVTQKYEASGVRFNWKSPQKSLFTKSRTGTLDFADGIVSVGTDDNGKILTFICPRVNQPLISAFGLSLTFSGEVEIGQVGGSIDPVTGLGTIYLDDVNFSFWGSVNKRKRVGGIQTVSKSTPAMVPVQPTKDSGSLIVLENIKPGAYAGQDPSKIFSSYLVNALVGERPQQPLGQNLLLSSINTFTHPGLLDEGTSLKWNIDLKQRLPVNGLDT